MGKPRFVLIATVAGILILLPVIGAHHLPLLDAPAHEARLAALNDLLFSRQGSLFYRLDTFLLPNIAFDVIGLGLSTFASPERAGQIFFALTLLLTLSGVMVLNRVVTGRLGTVIPVATSLLLYSLISILGFFSYAFGLALVPWALAARLKIAESPRYDFLAGAAMAVTLLFCHVFDFGIFAVMATGMGLAKWLQREISFRHAVLRALEHVPAGLLFLLISSGGLSSHPKYNAPFFEAKLFGIAKSVTSGSMVGDAAFLAGAMALLAYLIYFARPRLAWSFVPGIALLTGLYFALPFALATGSYVDSRLPIAIALLILGGLDTHPKSGAMPVLLIGIAVFALLVKQAAIAGLWRSFDPEIDSLQAAFDSLPGAAVVMQSECQPQGNAISAIYRERQPSLSHIAALAAFTDARFVANNFAIAGQQPIRVAPGWHAYYDLQDSFGTSTCSPEEYRKQTAKIVQLDRSRPQPAPVVYFLLVRPPQKNSLDGLAQKLASGPDFELYRLAAPP